MLKLFKGNFPYNNELTLWFCHLWISLTQNIASVNISNDLCYCKGSLSSRPESLCIKQNDNIKNLYNLLRYLPSQSVTPETKTVRFKLCTIV